MEVNDQLKAHAVLTPRKAVPLHTPYNAVWTPEQVWICCKLDSSLVS